MADEEHGNGVFPPPPPFMPPIPPPIDGDTNTRHIDDKTARLVSSVNLPQPPPPQHRNSIRYKSASKGEEVEVFLDEEAKKKVSRALNRYMSESNILVNDDDNEDDDVVHSENSGSRATQLHNAELSYSPASRHNYSHGPQHQSNTDTGRSSPPTTGSSGSPNSSGTSRNMLARHHRSMVSPRSSTAEILTEVEAEQAEAAFEAEFPPESLALLDRYMSHASFCVPREEDWPPTMMEDKVNREGEEVNKDQRVDVQNAPVFSPTKATPSHLASILSTIRSGLELYFGTPTKAESNPRKERALIVDSAIAPDKEQRLQQGLLGHFQEMFSEMDLNRTGRINPAEFEAAMRILDVPLMPEDVDMLFGHFASDTHSEGLGASLTLEDFAKLLSTMQRTS